MTMPLTPWRMAGHNPVLGYPHLANLQGQEPGLAIVRRFSSLNAKNVLYLQAELLQLEEEITKHELLDAQSDTNWSRLTCARLLMSAHDNDEHKAKILKLRSKLHEYNHMLLEQEKLYRLPKPTRYDLFRLRDWLRSRSTPLAPPEGNIWERTTNDLVALSTRGQDADIFSKWVAEGLIPAFGGQSRKGAIGVQVCQRFTILIASLLPTASIFALHYISNEIARLAFVMIFSAIFSTCLAVFTNAKRIEIFTSAVALASVQVVFIGTSG